MSSLKRAFLYVTRKKGKSILMFAILLIIATFALTSLSIGKSSDLAQESLRKTLGGEINLADNHSEENPYRTQAELVVLDNPEAINQAFESYTEKPITQKEIDTIMGIDGVVSYDAEIRDYIMKFADIEYIPGTIQLSPTEQRMAKASIVGTTEEVGYFRSGTLALTQGCHFGVDESNVAVISNDLAEKNGLALGDKLTLHGKNERLEDGKLYQTGETITEVTIVGIFEITDPIPKEEWVITPNTHEAIVTDEVFEQAQAIFRTRSKITMPDEPKSILIGAMKCGCCKKSLAFESRYRRAFYCHNRNMGFGCEDTKVDESVLIDTIFAAVKVKLALVEVSEQSYIADRQAKADEYASAKRELDTKLKKLRLAQATVLENYLEGKLEKNELQLHKSKTVAAIQEAEERLAALGALSEDTEELVEQHRPFYTQDTLTREMVKELIKEVRVYSPTELEIVWKFGECYQELEQGFMPNLNI